MSTKEQWISKIKSWVPAWFYEGKPIEKAFIKAIAKNLYEAEKNMLDEVAQTYIGAAVGGYLAIHGDERGLTKFNEEFDVDYRKRVRAITSKANPPALISLINQILIRGTASMKEDFESGSFLNRSAFLNRGELTISPIMNTHTIVVDRQVHPPYSFLNRGFFAGRGFLGGGFVGQAESSAKVFDLLIKTINEHKAHGTFYRIVERLN